MLVEGYRGFRWARRRSAVATHLARIFITHPGPTNCQCACKRQQPNHRPGFIDGFHCGLALRSGANIGEYRRIERRTGVWARNLSSGNPTILAAQRLAEPFPMADQGTNLRTMQDDLGHRDPKHIAHYTRVAGRRFEGLWPVAAA